MTNATEEMRVDICDRKYTVVKMSDGTSHCLRYGEEWQVYPEGGSLGNVMLAMAFELQETRAEYAKLAEKLGA